jgi:hypothetical protein
MTTDGIVGTMILDVAGLNDDSISVLSLRIVLMLSGDQ